MKNWISQDEIYALDDLCFISKNYKFQEKDL